MDVQGQPVFHGARPSRTGEPQPPSACVRIAERYSARLFAKAPALIHFVPLATVPLAEIDALLDRAFEPDRRRRTAYKVRGDATALPALSFGAMEAGALVGSIQCWPVLFTPDGDTPVPMVMVGPVAVAPERQRAGLGHRLMEAALAAAAAHGCDDGLVLIGDPEYYERFFGFSAERTAAWRLPGPVERHRLLAKGARVPLGPGALGPA